MKLYLVGRYKGGEFPNTIWDFEGLFSTEELADNACKADNYFYAEVEVDKPFDDKQAKIVGDTTEWPVIWPRIEEKNNLVTHGRAD